MITAAGNSGCPIQRIGSGLQRFSMGRLFASLVLVFFALDWYGALTGIVPFALVGLKLLPNIFFIPRERRVAIFAKAEQGSYLHEPKLSLADHFQSLPPTATTRYRNYQVMVQM